MTIEDYRIRLGWSQAELARKAGIDISTLKRAITVSKYLNILLVLLQVPLVKD